MAEEDYEKNRDGSSSGKDGTVSAGAYEISHDPVSQRASGTEQRKKKMAKSGKGEDILETIERERYDKPQECIDALLDLIKGLASALYPFYEENDE